MSSAPATPVLPEFDQVVKGNVDIKQLSKKKYKITFSEISKFLKYQIWSDSSNSLNENRKVYYLKAKKWVQLFNLTNDSLKASDKPLFTPTTVMEIGNNKYVFVLDKAKLNGKGRVVFKVSTEEIKLSEKKLLKLPHGHHDGVRFDIDYLVVTLCEDGNNCSCSDINTYAKSYNIYCDQLQYCNVNSPQICFDANWFGCGKQYSWTSTNIVTGNGAFPTTICQG